MPDTPGLNRLAPGFEFLQDLVKNAGAALPHIGQWVAPTLDPKEIAKRIEELRTVQFWLEQNARMLGATIQALEVQRMTLSTLKSMNVQMEDLRESLAIRPTATAASPGSTGATGTEASAQREATSGTSNSAASNSSVDPLQWWGALTQQFTELASAAVKDSAKGAALDAAKALAGRALQQGLGAADASLQRAAKVPAALNKAFPRPRRKPRTGTGV